MPRLRQFAAALMIAALTTPSSLAAQPGFPPDNPDSWKVAGTAKVLCSAFFVSGRDRAEARAHVADYFLREKLDSLTDLHVDTLRQLVRLTLANRITREAKRYGDQGCVIHQPGRDSVYFRPVRVATQLGDAAATPWPMGDLAPAGGLPPEVDSAKLAQGVDAAFANPAGLTAAFVIVHKGRIIAERYANGAHKDMQLESWSMGKSITGTLIGILIRQGAFKLEDPAPVPEWRKVANDPRARIRVIDLMRMSSGLRMSRGSPEDLPGYHDHDLIYTGAIDAFQFSATRPAQFEPNTFGRYRNDNPMLLGMLIRDAVRARGEEYLTWPQRALFDRIGIRRQVLETDPYGNFLLSGYDYGTARNWARIGMLYLNDGVWNGERLLPDGWTKFVSTPAPAWRDSSYGGMVWVNGRGTWPLPRDAFAFRGAGGQETYVVPSLDLVVVRMGHFPGSRVGAQDLQRALPVIAEAVGWRRGGDDGGDSSAATQVSSLTAAPQAPEPFKLGTFEQAGRPFLGVVLRDSIVMDLNAAHAAVRTGAASYARVDGMKDLIARYDDGVRSRIVELIRAAGDVTRTNRPAYVHSLSGVKILPPIMYPTTMLNVAVNYREHDIEMARGRAPGQAPPTAGNAPPGTTSAPGIWERAADDTRWNPYMFMKSPAAIVGHDENVVLPPGRTRIEWECELGVVVGRRASRVGVARASDFIFGYTLENDMSDRGGRGDTRHGSDWVISKNHDTFAPMGPFITPKEFVRDVGNLKMTFVLNGETLQEGSTSQMIHNVFEQVSYASHIMTLRPGDVIATGTPPGVGSARNPPILLKAGDRMACSYAGVGTLANTVVAAP